MLQVVLRRANGFCSQLSGDRVSRSELEAHHMSTITNLTKPSSAVAHSVLHLQMERFMLLASLEGSNTSRTSFSQKVPHEREGVKHNLRNFIAIVLLAFASTFSAYAQSTFGSIRGTIQDSSSAVIPGATVTVHSLDENFDRQVTTNDSGDFVVENLKAGRYQLTAHHDGFSDSVIGSVSLQALTGPPRSNHTHDCGSNNIRTGECHRRSDQH